MQTIDLRAGAARGDNDLRVAQTIYPLNRAHILSGAAFDLKVEFPGSPPPRKSQGDDKRQGRGGSP